MNAVDQFGVDASTETITIMDGYTPTAHRHVVLRPGRQAQTPFSSDDAARLQRALGGPGGVTKHRAVFDRQGTDVTS